MPGTYSFCPIVRLRVRNKTTPITAVRNSLCGNVSLIAGEGCRAVVAIPSRAKTLMLQVNWVHARSKVYGSNMKGRLTLFINRKRPSRKYVVLPALPC